MNTALILVDIQNDYFPGGKMVSEGSLEAGRNAGRLLSFFREKKLPLVHIQHLSIRPGATFLLPGTEGAEIHACVRPLEGEPVMQKNYPNSFRGTPLSSHLQERKIERLVLCGMMTHMCMDATVRAAFDYGFTCLVPEDACATRALAHQGISVPAEMVQLAFLAALNAVFAKVTRSEEIMSLLEG
jgi:nicotinamidase-related amidase